MVERGTFPASARLASTPLVAGVVKVRLTRHLDPPYALIDESACMQTLPLLQALSMLLYILSVAFPSSYSYSNSAVPSPGPSFFGTVTSPVGYLVLALFSVIRWSGVVFQQARELLFMHHEVHADVDPRLEPPAVSPPNADIFDRANDLEQEPSLIDYPSEMDETRTIDQRSANNRASVFSSAAWTLTRSPTPSRATRSPTEGHSHLLRPESSNSVGGHPHRMSLSTMGRPLSQVSSFFFSSPAPAQARLTPVAVAAVMQPTSLKDDGVGRDRKTHKTHHSLPSLSFPSLRASTSNSSSLGRSAGGGGDYFSSSVPTRSRSRAGIATPPLLSNPHSHSTTATSSRAPTPSPTPPPFGSSKKSRRPSLSALQLALDSPTFNGLRELISPSPTPTPTPKTPGSAGWGGSSAASVMELDLGGAVGEEGEVDPFRREEPSREVVENWRRKSAGGGVGEAGGRGDESVGRVSMVVEEEDGSGSGSVESTVEGEGAEFVTANFSTPSSRPAYGHGIEGRHRSASYTSTRSAFLEEFDLPVVDLPRQPEDSEDEDEGQEEEQEYLDPFPAPSAPEATLARAKLHRQSEEIRFHPALRQHSSAPPTSTLSSRPSLKGHRSTSPTSFRSNSGRSSPFASLSFKKLRKKPSRAAQLVVEQAEEGDRKSAYSELSFACAGESVPSSSSHERQRGEFVALGLGLDLGPRAGEGLEEDLVLDDAEGNGQQERLEGIDENESSSRRPSGGEGSRRRGSVKKSPWWKKSLSSRPSSFISTGTPYRSRSNSAPVSQRESTTTSSSGLDPHRFSYSTSTSGYASNALGLDFHIPTPRRLSPLSSLVGFPSSSQGGSRGAPRSSTEQLEGSVDGHSLARSLSAHRHSQQSHLVQPTPQRPDSGSRSLTSLEELTELVNSFTRGKAAEEEEAATKVFAEQVEQGWERPTSSSTTAAHEGALRSDSRPDTALSLFTRSASPASRSTSPFFPSASIGRTHTRTLSAPLSMHAATMSPTFTGRAAGQKHTTPGSTSTESLDLASSSIERVDSPSPQSHPFPRYSPSPSPEPHDAEVDTEYAGWGTLSSPTSFTSDLLPSSSTSSSFSSPTSPDFALSGWSRATRVRAKSGWSTTARGRSRTMSTSLTLSPSSVASSFGFEEGGKEEFEEEGEFERTMRV